MASPHSSIEQAGVPLPGTLPQPPSSEAKASDKFDVQTGSSQEALLALGSQVPVRIHGLKANPEVNGRTGVIFGHVDAETGRWNVRLDGNNSEFALLPQNLRCLNDSDSRDPCTAAHSVAPVPVTTVSARASIDSPGFQQQQQRTIFCCDLESKNKTTQTWATRRFVLCHDHAFCRFKGDILMSTAFLQASTHIEIFGDREFKIIALFRPRKMKNYHLRAVSTDVRNHWVTIIRQQSVGLGWGLGFRV